MHHIRNFIALSSDRAGNPEIYEVDADETNLVRTTNNSENDGSPTWSTDSTKLAFVHSDGAKGRVYVMNSDGTGVNDLLITLRWMTNI